MSLVKNLAVFGSLSLVVFGSAQTNIHFSVDLSGSGFSSIDNFVGFAAIYPGGTTNARAKIIGSVDSGTDYIMPNANAFGTASYEFVGFGTVTDGSGNVHVVVDSSNNIAGNSWDHYFGSIFGGAAETDIANELVAAGNGTSTALTKTLNAASYVLSYDLAVTPFIGYSVGETSPGFVTEFSNGVNIGTATTTVNAAPEPNGGWLLVGLTPVFLIRRRK